MHTKILHIISGKCAVEDGRMQSTYTVKFLISHLADPRGFQEEFTRVTDTIKPSFRPILTGNKPEVESALFLRMAAKIRATRLTPNLWRHS